jgi:multidrug efflux pump subunit AcrB
MMAGVVGKMLQEFAITVAVAVLVSAFISLSLTPTLCSPAAQARAKGQAAWAAVQSGRTGVRRPAGRI